MSLLDIRDVSLAFEGVRAVDAVTAGAEAGRVTALIGPNGAGKTSLLNILCGLLRPDHGSVHFRDRNITGGPVHRTAAAGMARTFQNLELFEDMSVRENVLLGRHRQLRSGVITSALRLPRHAAEERRNRPVVAQLLGRMGLEGYADWPATSLPYGLQRRVELARAMAAEPALLLLDEPMAGLSGPETAEVGELIRELCAEGLGVLLVEHDMDAVMSLSDDVLVLVEGAVLAAGAPKEIRSNPDVITAYLGEEVS